MNIDNLKFKVSVPVMFVDAGFPNKIVKDVKGEEDINGKPYDKYIYYMEHLIHTNQKLLSIICKEPKAVQLVVSYIIDNLPRNKNIIELNAKKLSTPLKQQYCHITSAINKLLSLDIIRRLNLLKEHTNKDKHIYVVNHNYIFNGNIKKLYNDLKLQRDYYKSLTDEEKVIERPPYWGDDDMFT